jgi:hypothetical protein
LGGGGGCIPGDLGRYDGVCCPPDGGGEKGDGDSALLTGCGAGYACGPDGTCLARNGGSRGIDPLVARLPRYRLCRQDTHGPPPLYGFPVGSRRGGGDLKLAYYSSHGDAAEAGEERSRRRGVETVLVVIHGVLRNADDYYCTALQAAAAAPDAERGNNSSSSDKTWVIAPLFAFHDEGGEEDDDDLVLENGGTPLRWGDDESDPWRSGASAATGGNFGGQKHVSDEDDDDDSLSSYRALDLLLTHLAGRGGEEEGGGRPRGPLLPRLKRVVVAGHSSGGQYAQRWSLVSPVWEALGASGADADGAGPIRPNGIEVRSVAANPSSYAYLHPLRWDESRRGWAVPNATACPGYDRWQWGLEGDDRDGDRDGVAAAAGAAAPMNPYVRRQLRAAGGARGLVERFRNRRVIYLAGGRDRCNVSGSGNKGWCDSHGLETACMDQLQGPTRWERFRRYLSGLSLAGVPADGRVADGVGHDHSLVFQSPEGLRALFGPVDRGEDGGGGDDDERVAIAAHR